MKLFSFFKKKEPSHSDKLRLAYRCFKPEMVEMIFPGGLHQAEKVIFSLSKLYKIDLEISDAKKYYEILSTYSDVVIRRIVTQSSDDHIITSLQIKHPDIIKDKKTAKKALAYVTINMKNNDFALTSKDDMSVLSFFTNAITSMEEIAKKNIIAETENLDDPEYGLVVNKPIYTQGVSGSNKYLKSLRTASGEMLTWNRRASISVEGINGLIDIYDSTLSSKKPYKTLYLNIYGNSNSTKAPKGFVQYNNFEKGKKHSLGSRSEIDAALKHLAESSKDYQDPPKESAMCYSIRTPSEVNISFVCSKCGENASMKVFEGSEDICNKYHDLTKDFIALGHKADVLFLCDTCAQKYFPSYSSWNKNNIVFAFTAKNSVTPVYSFPSTWKYNDFEYRVALAFLNGANTIEQLSEDTDSKLDSAEYLKHVRTVIGNGR